MTDPRVAALLILIVLTGASAGRARATDMPVELRDVSIEQRSGSATVTVKVTGLASYETKTLEAPARLVIDFKGAKYVPGRSSWTSGVDPIKEVRASQWRPGIARVVVELTRRMAYRGERTGEGIVVMLEPSGSTRESVPASIDVRRDDVIATNAPTPAPTPETVAHIDEPPATASPTSASKPETVAHIDEPPATASPTPAPKPETVAYVDEPLPPLVEATTQDGRQVMLEPDGTWKYATKPRRLNGKVRAGPRGARLLLAGREVAYGIWIDPSTWRPQDTKVNAAAEYEFVHVKGGGQAMVIAETTSVQPAAWKQIVLDNAKKVAPDARITREEGTTVNGVQVLLLQTEGTARDGPFVLYGYYYAGKQEAIQLITSTRPPLFEQYRADFVNLLNGFVLLD